MWKAIPGYPDYYVSDLGQVRGPRCVLKPQRHKQGYHGLCRLRYALKV